MFLAFEGPPRIVRLFGTGEVSFLLHGVPSSELPVHQCLGTVYEYGTPEYEELIPQETRKPGSRSVIMVDVHKVGSVSWHARDGNQLVGLRLKLHSSLVATLFHTTITKATGLSCTRSHSDSKRGPIQTRKAHALIRVCGNTGQLIINGA